MIEAVKSATFAVWGDAKRLTKEITELRIDYGPGYRVYFTRRGSKLIILLCGGDKRTQGADIRKALRIAADWDAT